MELLYLTVEHVLEIHETILDPGEPREIRDRGAIEAAVALPHAAMFGEDLYRDPITKAAALLRSLSQNHGFVQGNKRTAWAAMRTFLAANGFEVAATPEEVVRLLRQIAMHEVSVDEIVDFLFERVVEYPGDRDDKEARET